MRNIICVLLLTCCTFGLCAAAPSNPTVMIYYGNSSDMATVPLINASSDCYQVDYSGNSYWFPKSAMAKRPDFPGSPSGLDYKARRRTPCGVEPPPIPPVAKATAPASVCLSANPVPTSALITYEGQIQPVRERILQITPKCIAIEYGGSWLWTTADKSGGVACVGNTVQIDYDAANSKFNGMHRTTPPSACW